MLKSGRSITFDVLNLVLETWNLLSQLKRQVNRTRPLGGLLQY